ncbi:chloride channel protein [Chitinimonas naiadis]
MQDIYEAIRRHRLHDPASWLERLVVWSAAAGVGLVVVLFARLSEWAGNSFNALQAQWYWAPLLLTPLGGMLVLGLLRWGFQGAEGSGIPQTIAALQAGGDEALTGRFVSLRIALGKVGLGIMAVGAGFSTGREGPSVQVGASLMYAVRGLLPQSSVIEYRHLLVAGGAAGIAGAFNTPLAGIVFAIEELSRRYEQGTNGILLTAIVLAGMMSISLQGNYLYFGHFTVPAIDHRIILPVLFCALICGIAGGLFSRALLWSSQSLGWLGRWRQTYPIRFAGLCGLLVALLGLLTHGAVHGSGYSTTQAMLQDPAGVSVIYAPAKLLATLLSYFSGVPGGIFAPSLAVGAGIAHDLLPLIGNDVAAASIYALCMAGFLAAVTQSPITACIIVMEMIDGHEMVLSLMAVTLIGSLIAKLFSPALYHTLAHRQLEQALAAESARKKAASSDAA